MKRAKRALVTVAFLVPGLLPAAETPDLSLSAIIAGGEARRLPTGTVERGPGAVLEALAGVDRFPTACASPISSLLARTDPRPTPAMQQALALLGARPVLDSERTLMTRDGDLALHYSGSAPSGAGLMAADGDRNGHPDLVDRLAESLAAARSFLAGRMGFPAPTTDGARLEVYLADLGRGLEGITIPLPKSDGGPGVRSFLILDAGLQADRITPAALHQAAHASLLGLAAGAPPWWSEATAAFLTLAGTGDLRGLEAGMRARLQAPGRGLVTDSLLLMQGSALWPQFLLERTGDPGVVQAIWGQMASQAGDPLAAAEVVLRRSAGLTLAAAHREYAAWNLRTGARDDGLHYAFGRSLPETPVVSIGPGLPLRVEAVEPIEPLGSIAFRLPGDGRRGALDLQVGAEGGRPAVDLLVTCRSEPGGPVLVGVPIDERGSGRVSVPWGDVEEVVIILRNDATPPGGPARFELRGAHDPYAPFDLAAFGAEPLGASMVLSWTTAAERELLGWNVYRAETPAGPFRRLNAVALPAIGHGAGEVGYLFQDDSARPGRRYYYQVEGLSGLGLAERSHVISGRLEPPR